MAIDQPFDNRPHPCSKEYVDWLLQGHCAVNDARFKALEDAMQKQDHMTEIRFDQVNEFRESLRDQTKLYVTRNEHDVIATRQLEISGRVSELEGKLIIMVAGAGILLAICEIVLRFVVK